MKKNKRAKIKDLVCIMQNNEFRAFLLEKKLFSSELIIDQCIKTCSGSYEIIFLSFLIVPCHLQAKTYFYFNTNLHHEDERNACSKNHINKTVFCPLFNAKNRMSLSLLVLPLAFLLMSPYYERDQCCIIVSKVSQNIPLKNGLINKFSLRST